MSACRECSNKKQREFRKNNPKKTKKRDRAAYKRQQQRRIEYAIKYKKENPEKIMGSSHQNTA